MDNVIDFNKVKTKKFVEENEVTLTLEDDSDSDLLLLCSLLLVFAPSSCIRALVV